MPLTATDATPGNKTIGYQHFLPSQKAYDCDQKVKHPDRDARVELDEYDLKNNAPDCSFVIYIKDGIVYVTFKGTDSCEHCLSRLKNDERLWLGLAYGPKPYPAFY